MSVKSERRAWFAANVEARPVGVAAHSPEYMAWVKRANAHMVKLCVPGTATVRDVAPKAEGEDIAKLRAALTGDYTIAATVPESVAPVVIAEVRHVDIAPVTPIAPRRAAKPKLGRVVTTPLKVPSRVAVNALVSLADVAASDMGGGDVNDIAREARYLVLAAHPNKGFWWVQRFDGATGTSADLLGVRGKALKISGNGIAGAEYAAQPLDIAA